MLRALVLPGLDGDATLRHPFAQIAPEGIAADVAGYPSHLAMYDDLVRHLAPQLAEPIDLLIAESFAGPLAIRLAAADPGLVRRLVLIASFVTPPRGIPSVSGELMRVAPTGARWFVRAAATELVGSQDGASFAPALHASMKAVPRCTLAARVRETLRCDERGALAASTLPLLYLRAADDRLVPRAAMDVVASVRPDAQIVEVRGPHFLAQAKPDACWNAIADFAEQHPS